MSISALASARRAIRPRPSRLLRAARPIHGLAAAGTALAVLAGLTTAAGAAPALAAASAPRAQAQVPVPVHRLGPGRQRLVIPAMRPTRTPEASWPAAGTAVVTLRSRAGTAASSRAPDANALLARPSAGSARAGSLPVEVGPPDAAGRDAPAGVSVTLAARASAQRAGVSGLILSLARADGSRAPGAVHVSVSYASFARADLGGAADRLKLAELPACALTTPQVASCRRETPLPSHNDVQTTTIGADVALPGASAKGTTSPVVLAVSEGTSGSGGNYSATPLTQSSNWSAGGNSGAFTYSYPLSVPPVPGGLEPSVRFDYDSQTVDGLTSSTNNQASWIGDGWSYDPGFIERDYQACSAMTTLPAADQTGDLCWDPGSDVTTLMLDGSSTTLVDDPATGWHAEADNGAVITYVTGTGSTGNYSPSGALAGSSSNGTYDGGYWKVAETDGTTYYFGKNQLQGYASGDQAADSALTVPVYNPEAGDPCYNAAFSQSSCPMAWRWELDYVTDSRGDAMAYFYGNETNHYAADNGTTATTPYVQAAALQTIEYGLRAGAVYGATPAAEVNFTAPETRTDIPTSTAGGATDLACSSGAACTVTSPTFWSKYQLTAVSTEASNGTALEPADSWALTQGYETNTTEPSPPLWLSAIQRTGEDGTAASTPPVEFAWQPETNRVNVTDGYDPITRDRIGGIVTETGQDITVTYGSSCPSTMPADYSNTSLCFPSWWTPTGGQSFEDWFNKFVVTSITAGDGYTADAQPAVTTTYCYGSQSNCLSGGAWHYDDDTLTRSDQRTWDQWRGFQYVWRSTGSGSDPVTKTEDQYFRGLDGDYQGPGNNPTASTLTSSGNSGSVQATDADQYAGLDFEHTTYNGPAVVTDSVTTPWSQQTGSQAQPSPLPALTAYLVGAGEVRQFTTLAAPTAGNRESDTTYGHNSSGLVTWTASAPDAYVDGAAGPASEDTCTQTAYAANPATNLVDLPSEVVVTSAPPNNCPIAYSPSSPPPQSELVSDTQYYYDGLALGAAPAAGNLTRESKATSYSATTEEFTTQSASAYDEYGRVRSATDADGNTTTTQYTPAAGSEPASVTVTTPPTPGDSSGLATTTAYDPLRELPVQVTDPDGTVTSYAHDALGRVTAVWLPTASKAAGQDASYTYAYDVSQSAPSVVTTGKVEPSGTAYLTGETFYDSAGQQIETQSETPDGNIDVTMAFYDSDGRENLAFNSFYAAGAPSTAIVSATNSSVPYQTATYYDGDGRVTRQVTDNTTTDEYETDTSYGGNWVTVTPPSGGTPQTTYTNGLGQTAYIYQYHSSTPPGTPPAPGSGTTTTADQTAYTYYPSGALDTITDAAGKKWTYGYDLAGDQTSAATPDAGTTSSTYDPDGNLLSVTDANHKTISYSYDSLGRRDYECAAAAASSGCGTSMLASWTYDTLKPGEPTSSTAYAGGSAGQAYSRQVLAYDANGLPQATETTIPTGAPLAGSYITEDYYDNAGDLAKYTDEAAGGLPQEAVNIGYDAAGDPTSIGTSTTPYVSALTYTELGQPQEYTFGTTAEPAYLYDAYNYQGQLTEAKAETGSSPATVDDQHYGYDNNAHITSNADTAPGAAQVQCLQYDYLGRAATAWSQGGTSCAASPTTTLESGAAAPYWDAYTYNTEGDLTKQVSTPKSGTATTYANAFPATTGADGPHAIASQTDTGGATTKTTFGYDAAGNTTSIATGATTDTLNWNAAGRAPGQLTSVTSGSATVASYVYDASGSLLMQTDGSTTTLYLPDEQITSTTSGTTTTKAGTRYYALGGAAVAARTSAGGVYYLSGNQQGTDTVAVSASNLAVTRRYYDPYGKATGTAPAGWPGTRGFVGGTADPATGLTNLGARQYDPATGTFTSTDPVLQPGNPQDLNPYAYAYDDPATDSDPSGLFGNYGGAEGGCTGTAQACAPILQRQQTAPTGGTGPGGGGATTTTSEPGCNSPAAHLTGSCEPVMPTGQSPGMPGWVSTAADWVGNQIESSDLWGCLYSSNPGQCESVLGDAAIAASMFLTDGTDAPGPEMPAEAAAAPSDGVTLSLKYKAGWSPEQIAAADSKVAMLNAAAQRGELAVSQVERAGTSAASMFRSAGGEIPPGMDVDHMIDLQLGGADEVANMSPLDLSVNRSLGAQIGAQLRGVPVGTCVIGVQIC